MSLIPAGLATPGPPPASRLVQGEIGNGGNDLRRLGESPSIIRHGDEMRFRSFCQDRQVIQQVPHQIWIAQRQIVDEQSGM